MQMHHTDSFKIFLTALTRRRTQVKGKVIPLHVWIVP